MKNITELIKAWTRPVFLYDRVIHWPTTAIPNLPAAIREAQRGVYLYGARCIIQYNGYAPLTKDDMVEMMYLNMPELYIFITHESNPTGAPVQWDFTDGTMTNNNAAIELSLCNIGMLNVNATAVNPLPNMRSIFLSQCNISLYNPAYFIGALFTGFPAGSYVQGHRGPGIAMAEQPLNNTGGYEATWYDVIVDIAMLQTYGSADIEGIQAMISWFEVNGTTVNVGNISSVYDNGVMVDHIASIFLLGGNVTIGTQTGFFQPDAIRMISPTNLTIDGGQVLTNGGSGFTTMQGGVLTAGDALINYSPFQSARLTPAHFDIYVTNIDFDVPPLALLKITPDVPCDINIMAKWNGSEPAFTGGVVVDVNGNPIPVNAFTDYRNIRYKSA